MEGSTQSEIELTWGEIEMTIGGVPHLSKMGPDLGSQMRGWPGGYGQLGSGGGARWEQGSDGGRGGSDDSKG